MIRLIIGKKGSGKTKTLIELVKSTLETTNGAVVCIEKGDKLTYDIPYQCRLVDADKYLIADGQSLFGFVAGILASNHDVGDIFIDSALKICQNDADGFDRFLTEIEKLVQEHGTNFIITSSLDPTEASKTVLKYIG